MTTINDLETYVTKLEELVLQGERIVEDFLPNIGKCALQNYAQLNEFLIAASSLRNSIKDRVN
jgi:hypothetical protein